LNFHSTVLSRKYHVIVFNMHVKFEEQHRKWIQYCKQCGQCIKWFLILRSIYDQIMFIRPCIYVIWSIDLSYIIGRLLDVINIWWHIGPDALVIRPSHPLALASLWLLNLTYQKKKSMVFTRQDGNFVTCIMNETKLAVFNLVHEYVYTTSMCWL